MNTTPFTIEVPTHLMPALECRSKEDGRSLVEYITRHVLNTVATSSANGTWVVKPKYKATASFTDPWLHACFTTFQARELVPSFISEDGISIAKHTIASVQGLAPAVEQLAKLHSHNQIKKGIAYISCAHLMRGRITKYLYDGLTVPSTLAAQLLLTDETLTEP